MHTILRVLAVLTVLFPGSILLAAPGSSEGRSFQPEGRGGLGPDHSYDIQRLVLDLAINLDEGSVAGTATHHLDLLPGQGNEIAFHQTGLTIESVRLSGEDLPFRVTDSWLFVTLPEGSAAAEDPLPVEIGYRARPTAGLHFRRPGPDSSDLRAEVWSQGEDTDNRHWFPTWDHPSDRFAYEGYFTVDDQYTVISNGDLQGKEKRGDGTTRWHFALTEHDLVSYLVMVAVGSYARYEDRWRDRELLYFVPPTMDEETARLNLEDTPAVLDFFSEVTGLDYVYSDYKQVFVQRFIYSGMENTTATVMNETLLHTPLVHEEVDDWTEGVIAHEIAHQWYGDLLTCGIWREMWLNEGFASFLTKLWMSESRGPEQGAVQFWRTYQSVLRRDRHGARPLVLRFWNNEDDGRSNPYSKGSSVLQMLRVLLGEEVFFAGLRKYTRDNQYSDVETEDVRRAFEAVSGQRLDWFFDQWVFLAGHPKLSVKHSIDLDSQTIRVSIRQTQDTGDLVPRFILPIDLELATSEGTRVERLWMEDEEVAAVFDIAGDFQWLGFDPRGGLLAEVEQDQSPGEWLAQLSGSEFPYAQLRAFRALRDRKGAPPPELRERMTEIARDSSAPFAWRKEALGVIGSWRDDAASDVLLEVLASEETGSSRLRSRACELLGEGPQRPDVVQALDRRVRSDRVAQVRASALSALAALLGEQARPRILAALRQPKTYRWVLQKRAADLLGRWGEPEDLSKLSKFRSPRMPRKLLHASLYASVRIAERAETAADRRRARRPVARAAERLLYDLNLRTRQAAVSVLASVGDSRSIQELEALSRRENYPSLLRSAEGSIQSIRQRKDKDPAPTPGEVDARLKKLEERLDAAEKELKQLEERR
ncbi:MAG: M1 family metallopeptidase [Myxococcota bacterium]|nr:M1 family metallopeptidase [Myxococcota bacterium]